MAKRGRLVLIDWLTLGVPRGALPVDLVDQVRWAADRICRYNPVSGEVGWECSAWDSLRSDSHQVAMRLGAESLWIQGSPARVLAGDQVFGGLSRLDIVACAEAMLGCVALAYNVELYPRFLIRSTRVTRVDIARQFDCGSSSGVRDALARLRGVEGGRYRVSQQAGDSVYFQHRSRLQSGKIYAKGAHLRYESSRFRSQYQAWQYELADRLIRAEISLRAQYWRERARKPWYDWTEQDLRDVWSGFFDRLFSDLELSGMNRKELRQSVIEVADTEGIGRSAWATWCQIEREGWQAVRDNMSVRSFNRHCRVLRAAGFSDVDLGSASIGGVVVDPVRVRPVESWSEVA